MSVLPITHFCPLHFTHSFCFSSIVVAWCDLWGWESFGGQGWLMGTRACMFFLVSLWPSTLFHVFVWLVIYMLWKFHWFLTTLFHAWLLMGFAYLSWFQWVFFLLDCWGSGDLNMGTSRSVSWVTRLPWSCGDLLNQWFQWVSIGVGIIEIC